MLKSSLQKYLHNRAVCLPWKIENSLRHDFKAAVIIPAFAEAQSLPLTLASLVNNPTEYLQQTLILIVINNRTDTAAEHILDNQRALAWLKSQPFPTLNLAWVDASSPGLELSSKEGVGLARKIGCDLALSRVQSEGSLFISLDADTLVDENYLPALFAHFQGSQAGGAVLPFRHQVADDRRQEAAIRCYELYLRSYLFGLQQAGSPYAFHTVGSAIACRAQAYVAAGGMSRRRAAEDFYFLQQLVKTSGVAPLSGTIVRPSPRFSSRVPFGTGKAVQGLVEEQRQLFRFTSAVAFACLRHCWQEVAASVDCSAAQLLGQLAGHSPVLAQFFDQLDFAGNWERLQRNHADRPGRLAAFHRWFDGLRTRQLLARLDAGETRSGTELVAELLAWAGYQGIRRSAEQLEVLERLQSVQHD